VLTEGFYAALAIAAVEVDVDANSWKTTNGCFDALRMIIYEMH
jgi:hypothetical protein